MTGNELPAVRYGIDADVHSQAQMFQEVWDKYGRIDALCANAGIVDKRYDCFYAKG